MKTLYLLSASLILMACSSADSQITSSDVMSSPALAPSQTQSMIVAGGCFWCVESDFEKLDGVIEAVSGYTGGRTVDPTYKEVTYKDTGHYEAAKITFDPSVISYEQLLEYYWTTIDPTDDKGQFCDKGDSYRTAIFASPEQLEPAQASLAKIKQTKPFSNPIVTPVLQASTFYNAEDYHQDYYKKNPIRYKYYRTGCGRDARLKKLWGDK
jgi:peptide-methionine (S)-S-oxide reductase